MESVLESELLLASALELELELGKGKQYTASQSGSELGSMSE